MCTSVCRYFNSFNLPEVLTAVAIKLLSSGMGESVYGSLNDAIGSPDCAAATEKTTNDVESIWKEGFVV